MEAAKLKRESSDSHQRVSLHFQVTQKKVKELNRNLKGAILKSRLGITIICGVD
jgi:hypothetical protein